MDKPLRVMILEDRSTDQQLVKRQVLKFRKDCIFTVAEDKDSYIEKLDWFLPDLILADFNLPGFTGLEALLHAKENKPFIPFVFVTGGLKPGDNLSDIILKLANGFLIKDNLSKLPELIKEVMEKVEQHLLEREESLKEENKLRLRILKIASLIDDAEQFSKKGEVIALLEELIPTD